MVSSSADNSDNNDRTVTAARARHRQLPRRSATHNSSVAEIAEKPDFCGASWTTLETEGTTSQLDVLLDSCGSLPPSSSSQQQLQQHRGGGCAATATSGRRVRFATSGGDEATVRCEVRRVPAEEYEDGNLWYDAEDISAMRTACLDWIDETTVDSSSGLRGLCHATERFLRNPHDERGARRLLMHMSGTADVARGLEHHVCPDISRTIRQHAETVLREAAQRQRDDTTSARRLRHVAKKASRPARELALKRAQHDRKEACKASLSPWRVET